MANPTRFVLGGAITIVGLGGLAVASAHDSVLYYIGLAVFGGAVLAVAALIATARRGHPPVMRDEGPLPLHMQEAHERAAAPPPAPAMPGHGLTLQHTPSPVWAAASPWLRGAVRVVGAMGALVVASMTEGTLSLLAILVAAGFILAVFRHIAHGGRPHPLIPRFAPATPGACFALGTLFGMIGLVALIRAAQSHDASGQSVALIIAVAMVLLVFLLIGQAWDRRTSH